MSFLLKYRQSSVSHFQGQPKDLLFRLNGRPSATLGVEICEDLWVPLSPHEHQALAGATVLVNLSASNELIGKAQWRRTMVCSESGRCLAAFVYVSAGRGESSNDVVFGGHIMVAENGTILEESERLAPDPKLVVADIDLDRLAHDRRVTTTFGQGRGTSSTFRTVEAEAADPAASELQRRIDPHPFVPGDPARRAERCRDIFSMQVAGLAGKLSGAGRDRVVLGAIIVGPAHASGDEVVVGVVAKEREGVYGLPEAHALGRQMFMAVNDLPGVHLVEQTLLEVGHGRPPCVVAWGAWARDHGPRA